MVIKLSTNEEYSEGEYDLTFEGISWVEFEMASLLSMAYTNINIFPDGKIVLS